MKAYFQLIRWKNLLALAVGMLLLNYCVAEPIMHQVHVLRTWQLFLLILGVVLEAAGAYAINDYFDVKIDAINRPDTRIVGRLLDRKAAMQTYLTTSIVGALCGLVLALVLRNWTLGVLYVFMPGLAWFFSSAYKRQLLIGNLLCGIVAATTVLLIPLAQNAAMHHEFGTLFTEDGSPIFFDWDGQPYDFYTMGNNVYLILGCFAGFFGLMAFLQDIIQDCEDEDGDREMECRTLPIRLGQRGTKVVLYIFTLLTAAATYLFGQQIPAAEGAVNLTQQYLLFLVVIPLCVLIYIIYTAQCRPQWHQAGTLLKSIMISSILYSLVFLWQLHTF